MIKLKKITKIGVLSFAKIQAVLMGSLYLIISLVMNLVGRGNPEIVQQMGYSIGWGFVITYTLSGLIGGFIVGALLAYIYNIISPKVGAIEIELK